MKNLLIYINPSNTFSDKNQSAFRDCSTLVRIQIDNSLDLGWKKEDIVLVTNFNFEYNGVRSLVIPRDSFCPFRPLSTKTTTVSYLLEKGLLEKDGLYWVHDFDAYQLYPIEASELELDNFDAGFTDYGWSKKVCLGSYFFKARAKQIFKLITDTIYAYQLEDERAFMHLAGSDPDGFNKRYKKLNITYNFGMRNISQNFQIATKPLKVLHFHPHYKDTKLPETTLNMFMYGKNELNMPLMSPRLIKIFHHHGINE